MDMDRAGPAMGGLYHRILPKVEPFHLIYAMYLAAAVALALLEYARNPQTPEFQYV
jgi:hypothetical protein